MEIDEVTNAHVARISKEIQADIFFYSGDINHAGSTEIVKLTTDPTNPNVLFILCTPGGTPNDGYKIARRLQNQYEKFTLFVHGYCKSAGTLIAIGSDEIVMSDTAEFGPLDVQTSDGAEIGILSSGLTLFEAMRHLQDRSYEYFKECLIELVENGLSTKNAAAIAATLSTGLYAPAMAGIEPNKIGELSRSMKIAIKYGEELIGQGRGNIAIEGLVGLVTNYPEHSYVIDRQQAEKLFSNVRGNTNDEQAMAFGLKNEIKYPVKGTPKVLKLFPREEAEHGKNEQGSTKGSTEKPARATETKSNNLPKPEPANVSG